MISVDEEAGDVTRLDAATGSRFPGAAALGRIDDVAATEAVAAQVGSLLVGAGITLNLAPCADVMVDPLNPVIGIRSFGSDPELVSRHTAAWVRGQQSAGVAACVKHFPGHGDTDADTHEALAVLDSDLHEVVSTALPPFAAAIDAGVAAVMAGHLLVPAVDALPATVSHRWLVEILRGEMGFTGTVVTDALEMAAMAATYGIAEAAVLAIAAGADLLCLGGEDAGEQLLARVVAALVDAVRLGRLSEDRLRDAAARTRSLAAPSAHTHPAAPAGLDGKLGIRLARRAVDVAGPLPGWPAPANRDRGAQPLVVRCEARTNIAVGGVPWGPAAVSDTSEIVLRAGDPMPIAAIRGAGRLLLVTRDRHRHPFMTDAITAARSVRPDTVVLEMGTTGLADLTGPALATFGATAANARAALDALGAPDRQNDPVNRASPRRPPLSAPVPGSAGRPVDGTPAASPHSARPAGPAHS